MWQLSTQASALRYSRLIHTGGFSLSAIAVSYCSGSWQPNASMTTSAGSVSAKATFQWRISTPWEICELHVTSISGLSACRRSRSSSHSRTASPCSVANCLARRQQTPISPKLSMTAQKISQREDLVSKCNFSFSSSTFCS